MEHGISKLEMESQMLLPLMPLATRFTRLPSQWSMPCGNLLTQRVIKHQLLKHFKLSLMLKILAKLVVDGTLLAISEPLLLEDQLKTIFNQPLNNQLNKLLLSGFKQMRLDTFSIGLQRTNTGMPIINSTTTQPHHCTMMPATIPTLPNKLLVNTLHQLSWTSRAFLICSAAHQKSGCQVNKMWWSTAN